MISFTSCAPGAPMFLMMIESGERPADHLQALYGRRWRDAFTSDKNGLHSRRLPGAGALAAFLAPALCEYIAFDGSARSATDRWNGWWVVDGSGWVRTSRPAIARGLSELADEMYDLAESARRAECRFAARHAFTTCNCAHCALVAAMDAVGAVARNGHRLLGPLLLELQDDPRFLLPASAHDGELLAWFDEAADAEGWQGRVLSSKVWAAYELSGGSLPKHALFRRLDALVGPRNARREFPVPDPEALAAPLEAR